jgi:hypothetical protein
MLTALHDAVDRDDLPLVKSLLDARYSVNMRDSHGEPPLRRVHSLECARLLLRHGADPNAVGNNGESLLREFAHYSSNVLLLELLKAGAAVEFRGPNGNTALHRAVYNRRRASVCTLLAFGADPNAEGRGGNTPIELTVGPLPTVLGLLFAAGAEPRSALFRVENFAEEIVAAKRAIALERFGLIRERMLTICIGLQALQLPALVTVAVLDEAIALAPLVELHFKWDCVVAVKHFECEKKL